TQSAAALLHRRKKRKTTCEPLIVPQSHITQCEEKNCRKRNRCNSHQQPPDMSDTDSIAPVARGPAPCPKCKSNQHQREEQLHDSFSSGVPAKHPRQPCKSRGIGRPSCRRE